MTRELGHKMFVPGKQPTFGDIVQKLTQPLVVQSPLGIVQSIHIMSIHGYWNEFWVTSWHQPAVD